MSQFAWPVNGANVGRDFQFTAAGRALIVPGVIYSGDLLVTTNSVAAGEAFVLGTRANGEKVLIHYRNTAAVTIDTSGTKKVFLLVDLVKLENGSGNSVDGTGIVSITTDTNYPASNYIPLASITAGSITDEREVLSMKPLIRKGLTATRILKTDSSGNESYIAPGISGQFLGDDFTFKTLPPSLDQVFGDGSDGSVWTGALTITGSNDSLIVRNYTNFAPGANTVTITPTGCITIIKVKGDLNLTGTTINFSGKGKPGSNGGTAWPSNQAGTDGTAGQVLDVLETANTAPGGWVKGRTGGWTDAGGGGGGGASIANNGSAGTGGTSSAGGAGGINSLRRSVSTFIGACGFLPLFVAQGGGGGAGGSSGGGTAWAGGAGGTGGGYVAFIVSGNVTISGTTVNCSGSNGSNGVAGTGSGGGGGGGGGGAFFLLYGGTLTGSVVPNVAWGSGGGVGPAGGAGGAGLYAIQKLIY